MNKYKRLTDSKNNYCRDCVFYSLLSCAEPKCRAIPFYDRLQELENKIEKRALVELQHGPGDVIYVTSYDDTIVKTEILRIIIDKKNICYEAELPELGVIPVNKDLCYGTKEEAEQKLKEMRGDQ